LTECSELAALAVLKANAWEIRRILAAADSFASRGLLLSQAAIFVDALGDKKKLKLQFNKLSLKVSCE
jgi:hypothetical protein